MFIKEFKQSLPYLIETGIVPVIIGKHGIGKSEAVKQFCTENMYKFVDLRLGTQDVGDLVGLPDFVKENGFNVATKFMMPNWMRELLQYCEDNPKSKGILFLDEVNRGRRDVLQAIFQLLLDKKMHEVQLPENVGIVCAMNPNTEDYVTIDLSDEALISRFCHIILRPSVNEWLDYGKKTKADSEVLSFIQENPKMLEEQGSDFSIQYVKPCRRSWTFVSKLRKSDVPPELFQELCAGVVGHAATVKFITHLNNSDKPLKALDILNNFSKHKKKIEEYSDNNTESNGRLDLINVMNEELYKYLEDNKKLTKKQQNNFMDYLKTIPKEASFSFLQKNFLKLVNHHDMFTKDDIKDIIVAAKVGIKDDVKVVK